MICFLCPKRATHACSTSGRPMCGDHAHLDEGDTCCTPLNREPSVAVVVIEAWLDWADAVHEAWMTPWYVALALMGRSRREPRRPT